jgi:hypothetical protein
MKECISSLYRDVRPSGTKSVFAHVTLTRGYLTILLSLLFLKMLRRASTPLWLRPPPANHHAHAAPFSSPANLAAASMAPPSPSPQPVHARAASLAPHLNLLRTSPHLAAAVPTRHRPSPIVPPVPPWPPPSLAISPRPSLYSIHWI